MNDSLSYLEISRENLLHNLSVFRDNLVKGRKISAVVKANAYGHGLSEIVTILNDQVDYFQVDDIEELRLLRAITDKPCLVLGYVLSSNLEELVHLNGILGVFELAQIEKLNEIAIQYNKIVIVHVEVDAFLGRLGVLPEKIAEFINEAKKFPNVVIDALYAHFSDIEDSENLDHANRQYIALHEIAEKNDLQYHIAATSGVLADQYNHWNGSIVRLGIGLYGIWPSEHLREQWESTFSLQPVLQWKTHVAQVKILPAHYPIGYGRSYITTEETKIAVIPQGYSDGYDRLFSNNGTVLIQGIQCRVLGRIAMNMFVVDITGLEIVEPEEEVVLLGKQGGAVITAEEMAQKIETINYEILARIPSFLPRKVC